MQQKPPFTKPIIQAGFNKLPSITCSACVDSNDSSFTHTTAKPTQYKKEDLCLSTRYIFFVQKLSKP